jgi:hypothetical protein
MPQLGLFFAAFYFSALLTALGWNILRALIASAWLKLHPVPATPGPTPSNPLAVAFLIHGTWAPNARWTWSGSPLRRKVEAVVGEGRVRFESFAWSGHNRIFARRDAALRLRGELDRSLEHWPGVPHYLIAHSHGGNIALSALESASMADRIAGVICLSTPFLQARTRDLGGISSIALSAAPAFLLVWLGQLVQILYPPAGEPVVAVCVVLALIAAILAPRAFRRIADRLQRAFVSTSMPADRVLILRTPGDEAYAALATAHLVSWLIGKAWSIPGRALAGAVQTVERWNTALATRNLIVIPATSLLLVSGGYLMFSEAFTSSTQVQAVGSTMMTTALTIFAIRLKGGLYGFLLGLLFAGLLTAPVPVLLGLAALPISPELALAAILLEVTAESTPPGSWNVRQLGGAELSGEAHAGGAPSAPLRYVMMHSLSYEHPLALETIGTWLTGLRTRGSPGLE